MDMDSPTKTDRRDFLRTTAAAATLVCGLSGVGDLAATPARKDRSMTQPNLLVFLADDLGWADVGYHGAEIQTPNLDRLCAEGIDLDQHYVCPVCTPTRTSLLTGRYCSRWGDQARTPCNQRVLPFGTETLASVLRSVGYDTGLSGKWHLGSKPEWGPNRFGFNRSYGSLAGGVGPYDHRYKQGPFTYTWHRDDELIDEPGHVTDLIGREVVGWIRQKRNPWFYYVPFTAVHIPVQAPPDYLDLYAGKRFYEDPLKDEAFKRYAAYATQMDDWVGRIVAVLEETGQRDQTLVLFMSDNGAPTHGWVAANDKYPGVYPDSPVLGSNGPLRAGKATVYEGGIRTPAWVNWPARLSPGKRTAPIHIVDWMPTLARLAGYRPPREPNWDGEDVWSVLTGEKPSPSPRRLYFPFVREQWAVRQGDWKLLSPGRGKPPQLYDLAVDPCETRDHAAQAPGKVKQLTDLLTDFQAADVHERPPDPT